MIRILRTASVLCTEIPCVAASLVCARDLQAAEASRHDDTSQLAEQIMKTTGVRGGLIVHLGCGDGQLTCALFAGDNFLVHGLESFKSVDFASKREYTEAALCGLEIKL